MCAYYDYMILLEVYVIYGHEYCHNDEGDNGLQKATRYFLGNEATNDNGNDAINVEQEI
jgi:hypothetical protein